MALQPLKEIPEWWELCTKYRYDIYAFAVEALGIKPTWQQELLFRSIAFDGSRTSVASGHGCFGIDTPIMLSTGDVKPVQDITVGDRLMGDDGQSYRNVLELRRGSEQMYRFTYADGSSHIFNESHILCLVATNTKGRRKTGDRVTVTVRDWLQWGADKKRCHAIYRSKITTYETQLTTLPIDPYILGVWLGDGSSYSTRLYSEDKEVIDAWKKYADDIGCLCVEHNSSSCGNASCFAISKGKLLKNPFLNQLKTLKLLNNKHIPACYMTASIEDRLSLLAGLIDTDGSLDGCSYDFIQKNKILAEQVLFLARSVGCHATLKKVIKTCGNNGVKGTYFRLTIGRNIDIIPVRIERKKRPNLSHQRRNLHFSIKAVESLGVGHYYGFVLDGNSQFLGGDFTVLHNTGKTASAGIVALWHLLFFDESIMMFTAPQIGQLKKQVWKEISINLERLRNGSLAWLAEYVGYQSEMVYIKGYKEKWYVFAKTAPKHQPTNIAGNHGDNYMVWGDEACGISDEVWDVVLGALTHQDNRAVMTSQPAKSSGMFYDTHHRLSHRVGGAWVSLVFNGEESPIVSMASIREQLLKYGSRDDPQYQIRVLGRFPDRLDEFLVSMRQAEDAYVGSCIFDDKEHRDYGYVITVDVGGGVGRDDSVIAVSKVWGEAQWGDRARRVEVIDIPLCKNKDDIDELYGVITHLLDCYSNATLVVDDNGAGKGLGQKLKNNGYHYTPVYWGGACFNNENRKQYFNKRAQAYVCFSRAVAQGRFKLKVKKFATKFKDQIIHIPYSFDDQSRYKIMSKDEMRKQGIKSPDLGDAFAFLFLENVHYAEAYESTHHVTEEQQEEQAKEGRFSRLREAGKAL